MKLKNKKITALFAAASLITCGSQLLFSQNQGNTETSLYNEINSAWSTGFLPGVIEKSSVFERKYPESPYINEVRLQKARALVAAGQNDSAIESLLALLNFYPESSSEALECYYLLGRAYFEKNLYRNALSSFYCAAKLIKDSSPDSYSSNDFYNQSLLYAGRIYFNQDDYKAAVSQFEYVVSNGNKFSQADFNEALQKLIISYNETNQGKKSILLFQGLSKSDFDSLFYYTTAVYAAQGYEKTGDFQKAYDLYCEVIDAGIESLSVIALKKAYLLADQKKVGLNPGEVFSRNTALFESQPELVCDFWIRLGIDEFDAKNYDTCLEYLSSAEKLINEGVKGDPALISLYRAKVVLERQTEPKILLLEKKEVESQFETFKKSKTENIMDAYYSTLLQFNVLLKEWDQAAKNYAQIKKPDAKASYHNASLFYNRGDYSGAKAALENYLYDASCKKLYASSCLKNGEIQKAAALYSELDKSSELDEKSALEYVKALFMSKRFSQAYEKSRGLKSYDAFYMGGLCLINLKKWNDARASFNSYISAASGKSDFNILSFFYRGYAEYNLGEFKNSYASFVRFTSEAPATYTKYIRQGYDLAVKSALQNGDFKNASAQAENLVKISENREEKQEAVLLNAQIYSDWGNEKKAVDSLLPYTNDKSDFALQALYQIALIYEKKGETALCESYLEKIISKAPRSALAEEALYHTGEIYYSKKDYASAENRFNKYIYKYADGKYGDAALFFCADCNYQLGSFEKAIMLCELFVKRYPESIYSYGLYTCLLNSYEDEEDYENAFKTAGTIIQKFPDQAAGDGIGKKSDELKRLVSGSDKTLALKQNEYEKAGRSSTREGRKIGSELVRLYMRNPETENQGIELARSLCEIQKKSDSELDLFAQNISLVAEYQRKNGDYRNSARNYLEAATAFRSLGNSEKAAESLYSGAEAFNAAKLKGDARETAKTLKELYPQSHYAASVDRITE